MLIWIFCVDGRRKDHSDNYDFKLFSLNLNVLRKHFNSWFPHSSNWEVGLCCYLLIFSLSFFSLLFFHCIGNYTLHFVDILVRNNETDITCVCLSLQQKCWTLWFFMIYLKYVVYSFGFIYFLLVRCRCCFLFLLFAYLYPNSLTLSNDEYDTFPLRAR